MAVHQPVCVQRPCPHLMIQQGKFHRDLSKFASYGLAWEVWTSRWHFDTLHLASSDTRGSSGSTTTTANIHKYSWRRADWEHFNPIMSCHHGLTIKYTHTALHYTILHYTTTANYSSSCLACPCLHICNNHRNHIQFIGQHSSVLVWRTKMPTLNPHNRISGEKWKLF